MIAARRALSLALAYGAAVAAATALTVLLVCGWILATGGLGSKSGFLADLFRMFWQGWIITALTALPGWLLSVMLAETFAERRRGFFLATGAMTALFAHALLIYSLGSGAGLSELASIVPVVVFSVAGGIIGGLVHWRIAGRQSGAWGRSQ